MKRIYYHLFIAILLLFCSFTTLNVMAFPVSTQEREANQAITSLYSRLNASDMASWLDFISAQFIDKPYVLGALGEGSRAYFDQFPLYRVDAFDCDTYVTTILALALANNLRDFKQCLKAIRYQDGQVSYLKRNHFMELDWILNNQQQGFIRDVTFTIKDEHQQSVTKLAIALIDKPAWFAHLDSSNIRLLQQDKSLQQLRLAQLHHKGQTLDKKISVIPYIPLSILFQDNKPNLFLFSQIPNGAIIEIVRPNWNMKAVCGTNLNISHLGFAFWKNNQLLFRQASSRPGKVVDTSLIAYLNANRMSPTVRGINIQTIVPGQPLKEGCALKA